MTLTIRDALRQRLPRWLRGTYAGRIAYAIGQHADTILDLTIDGLHSWFPGLTTDYNLDAHGRQRRIRRGLSESDVTYAARLLRWLDDHPQRGGPYAMLRQLHAFYAPSNFRIELVNISGRRYLMQSNGTITRDDLPTSGDPIYWAPDNPAKWARWWLFLFVPDPPDNEGLWGDPGLWGDGGLWGVELTAEELDLYQVVPSEWKAAHAEGRVVILGDGEGVLDYEFGTWPVQIGVRS